MLLYILCAIFICVSGETLLNGTSKNVPNKVTQAESRSAIDNLLLPPTHRDLYPPTALEIRIKPQFRDDIPYNCPIICPPSTVQVKDVYCFRYVSTPMNWHNAKKDCEQQGGYLAKPDLFYHETASELGSVYRDIIGKSYIWIGATDLESTILWKWLDGEILSSSDPSWIPGHPSNYVIENCANIRQMKRGKLQISKSVCTYSTTFLCQFSPIQPSIVNSGTPILANSTQESQRTT